LCLCVAENSITDEGAARLATALEINTSVTKIYLGDKGITDKGAASLIQVLATNMTITCIDLRGCWQNVSDQLVGDLMNDIDKLRLCQLKRNKEIMSVRAQAQATFQSIDINGDGILDALELSAGLCDSGLTDTEIEALFFNLDSNSDNQVSEAEFIDGHHAFIKASQSN